MTAEPQPLLLSESGRSLLQKQGFTILGIIFCAAVVLSIYGLRFVTAVQPGVSHDDAEYLVLAESFATGRPYRLINYPDAPLEQVWPPGYPLIVLTLPWLLFGPNITLLRLINVLLAIAGAIVGYRLLAPWLSWSFALLAALLFALNPTWIGLATLTMSDVAFTLFVLGFLLAFSDTQAGKLRPVPGSVLSILLLAAAILIRYWGVAFLGAALLYLVVQRKFRSALAIGGGTSLLLLPYVFFLLSQAPASPDSFFAVSTLSRAGDLSNLATSVITYWKATPLVLVPILGPAAAARLAGFAWSIDVIHSFLLVLVGVGLVTYTIWQRFLGLAVLVYGAFLLALTGHIDGTTQIFDEPRYLAPILLFLYASLLLGAQTILRKIAGQRVAQRIVVGCAVVLVGVLVLRNIQQSRVTFPVADLSAGAEWAQTYTDPSAVFMTPDPVSRYIYLRRYTVGYPIGDEDAFWEAVRHYNVSFIMLAPPLTIARSPNVTQSPDPRVTDVLLPAIAQHPDCFVAVFRDPSRKTEIFQVADTCR